MKLKPIAERPPLKRRAYALTRGERVCHFIEKHCVVPEGTLLGQKMKLEDFQYRFIIEVYDNPFGTTRGDLSIGRKNGKSGLIAAICLAHIVGPEAVENSQIVSGARSQEQAATVFKLMVKMINKNPLLQARTRIVPSGKRIYGLALNVEYRALAAEGKTAHGLSPILVILDETGQVRGPHDDFIDALITAQGAYENPLVLNISTQAPNDNDLLSIWLDDARNSGDPTIVSHVYTTPKDSPLLDEDGWRASNPAMGKFRSVSDIRKLAEQAKRMPTAEATFRNLYLNQRVEAKSPFISKDVWDDNKGAPGEPGDAEITAGLDLSGAIDLTALVCTWKVGDKTHVLPYAWTPESTMADRQKRDRVPYAVWAKAGALLTTPGKTVDYDFVAHFLLELIGEKGYKFKRIGFDRWRIDLFKAALLRQKASQDIIDLMVPFGQGFKDMAPAIDMLEDDLLNGRIAHGGHPVLTACAANSVILKDPAGNRKLDKVRSTGRIDAMVALAIAKGVADQPTEEAEGDYDDFLNEPIIV